MGRLLLQISGLHMSTAVVTCAPNSFAKTKEALPMPQPTLRTRAASFVSSTGCSSAKALWARERPPACSAFQTFVCYSLLLGTLHSPRPHSFETLVLLVLILLRMRMPLKMSTSKRQMMVMRRSMCITMFYTIMRLRDLSGTDYEGSAGA
jgi:hypothetical protein